MNNHEHRKKQTYESYTFQPLMSFWYDSNVFRSVLCGQWTCSPAFQVTVYLSSFRIYPFVTTVVVSKGTETNKFFGFPALSLCNLNAFNTRRFRDLYNGSSNVPFIERYIKDISLMATKSEEILTKEFKSRNIGPFYRFQTPGQTLGVKGIMSHQVAEMLLPSKSRSSIHAL